MLGAGSYYLKELHAPDGYIVSNDVYELVIHEDRSYELRDSMGILLIIIGVFVWKRNHSVFR